MDARNILQPDMTVEDVLKAWPSAYTVFLKGKAECIGCFLQKFCTLQELAIAYDVSLDSFMAELENHIQKINHSQRSS
ncbi:MAG: hypothetical protein QM730_26060 [Anaerolineales bacterium]